MSNKRGVYKRLLPDATVPRHAFDKSTVKSFHYSAGMLTPCYGAPALAKSRIEIDRGIFQRTNQVNTAAFATLDTHLMFYFVPLKSLFSRFEEMKLNIQDVDSTLLSGGNPSDGVGFVPSGVPVTHLASTGQVGGTSIQSAIYNNNTSWKDAIGYDGPSGAFRLLDLLRYGNYPNQSYMSDSVEVNMLIPQAYQKVYFDNFRNTAYESNDPFAYNVDYAYAQNSGVIPESQIRKILTLRYVNYRKDFMQNIYPGLDYVLSLPNGTSWSYPNWIQDNNAGSTSVISGEIDGETESDYGKWTEYDGSPYTPSEDVKNGTTGTLYTESNQMGIIHSHDIFGDAEFQAQYLVNAVNPQTIRAMFALDKLMRATAYAPKHMKQQYEARYGIKYPSNPCDSVYIGGWKNDILIGEVTQTVNTAESGSNLGAIGGKGVGSDPRSNKISFTAPVDGIIIGVIYTLPRTSYDSTFIGAYNLKHIREDFFIPEFMDMGLTPITQREINMNYKAGVTPDQQSDILTAMNRIKGFRPPYEEYKTDVDSNHGLFARNPLAYGESANEMSVYVVHSNNQSLVQTSSGSDGLDYTYFKVKPSDLDSIFTASYDSTDLNTDQFMTYLRLNITVNQNMSIHGQPRLGVL